MIRYLRPLQPSAAAFNSGTFTVAVLLSAVLAAQQRPAETAQAETYESATTDARGRLIILTSDNRTIVVAKDGDQTSFAKPMVSSDRTAVGAQALFPNCCTSYDLPLQLVVYSRGKVHRFRGVGVPIFQWHFADAGARVAFGQEPAHFGCAIHYELRDIHSERLLDAVDIPQPCGQIPTPKAAKIPKWVTALNSARK